MSNSICYENSFADIHNHGTITRISYIRCSPPRRLRPKGTLVLLHDFFKTNYQFRYVVDLFAMGGFVTIIPDLPGKHISIRHQPDARVSLDSLCSDLASFLRLDIINERVHLVGIGMGAHLASTLSSRHNSKVASVVLIDAQTSQKSTDALKFLSSMPAKIPSTVRRNAFARYLDIQSENTSLLSSEDINEYADSFSEPRVLLNMQQAYHSFQSTDCNLKDTSEPMRSLAWSPEEQPEDFTVAVLSVLKLSTPLKSTKRHSQSHTSRL